MLENADNNHRVLLYLHCISESGIGSNFAKNGDCLIINGETLGAGSDLDDLNHLLLAVRQCSYDQ